MPILTPAWRRHVALAVLAQDDPPDYPGAIGQVAISRYGMPRRAKVRSHGTGGGARRTPSPAGQISGALRHLERDGLITWCIRADGLSGIGYKITAKGRDALATMGEPDRLTEET